MKSTRYAFRDRCVVHLLCCCCRCFFFFFSKNWKKWNRIKQKINIELQWLKCGG